MSLPTPMPESSGALVLYVSPISGSDSNNGTSVNTPYKTINRAWTHASLGPGSIIYLRGNDGEHGSLGGNTAESNSITVTAKYGSSTDPITMETYPGDPQAVINGTRLHLNPGDLRSEDYNGNDGFNCRIRNIHFKGTVGSASPPIGLTAFEAIKSNNPINFEISECLFEVDGTSPIVIRGMSRAQTLNGAINSSQTTITLNGTANLLNATPYYLGIGSSTDSASCTEIVRVTNVSGNDLTVERGALGSTAQAHNSGVGVLGYWRGKNVQIFNNIIRNAGMRGTRVDGAQSISTGGTLTVEDTSMFAATGSLNNTALVIEGVPVALAYTAKTATTFTLGTVSGGPYSLDGGEPILNSWCSGHAHGIYYGSDWGTREGAIYNNLIYNVSAMGITLHEETDDCVVAYNTIDYCGRGGINIASEGAHAGERNVITSNIITNILRRSPIQGNNQSGFAINVWWPQVDVDVTAIDNLIDRTLWDACESGYHLTEGSADFPTGTDLNFQNDINDDPLYLDRANGDYQPANNSPAKSAGDTANKPSTDLYGNARTTADIGAIAAEAAGAPKQYIWAI